MPQRLHDVCIKRIAAGNKGPEGLTAEFSIIAAIRFAAAITTSIDGFHMQIWVVAGPQRLPGFQKARSHCTYLARVCPVRPRLDSENVTDAIAVELKINSDSRRFCSAEHGCIDPHRELL